MTTLSQSPIIPVATVSVIEISESRDKWHGRCGHPSEPLLKKINQFFKLGIKASDLNKEHAACQGCISGKSIRKRIHKAISVIYKPIAVAMIAFVDLIGPVSGFVRQPDGKLKRVRTPSLGGGIYILVIVEGFSKLVVTKVLQLKSQATREVCLFINRMRKTTGRTLSVLSSDGGGEFLNKEMYDFIGYTGTQLRTTTPEHPQHNGVVERMNGKLLAITRTLMITSGSPSELWGEAFTHAAFIHNILPLETIDYEIPFVKYCNFQFDVLNDLKTWGCDAHVVHLARKQSKVESKTWVGIYVGWDQSHSAHRIMDSEGKICLSRDVKFNENSFESMKTLNRMKASGNFFIINDPGGWEEKDLEKADSDEENDSNQDFIGYDSLTEEKEVIPQTQVEIDADMADENPDEQDKHTGSREPEEHIEQEKYTEKQQKELNKILRRIEAAKERELSLKTRYGRRLKPRLLMSIQTMNTKRELFHLSEILAVVTNVDVTEKDKELLNERMTEPYLKSPPKSYKEAMASDEKLEWLEAIKKEHESLIQNGTWKLVQRKPGMKILKGKWVLDNKLGSNNQLLRRKARYVIKGYEQIFGIDYSETFSPVVKSKTIRMLLTIAAKFNLELKHIDFDTAFLNGELEEVIFMEQPEGFVENGSQYVCELKKSIYGLKQAARVWYKAIDALLQKLGYKPCAVDPCFYTKVSKTGKRIYLSIYVDDAAIAYEKQDEDEWLNDKTIIGETYKMKDIGDLHWILNMKVERDREKGTITLCQNAYIEGMLERFNLLNITPVVNPEKYSNLHKTLDGSDGVKLDEAGHSEYRMIIGGLLYASITTRVDISHIVGQLSRFLAEPCEHHMDAATHVLKYLAGTKDLGVKFGSIADEVMDAKVTHGSPKSETAPLQTYTDANWGSDLKDRRSVSGTIVKLWGSPVSWISRRQATVALSTTEAEYIAVGVGTQEVLWFRMWLKEVMGLNVTVPIYCDNISAISLTGNETDHQRTKHIDIRHHFVRDHVTKQDIEMRWITTKDQEADILTKMLPTSRFQELRDVLLVHCA